MAVTDSDTLSIVLELCSSGLAGLAKGVANKDVSLYIASSKHWSYESTVYSEILASGREPTATATVGSTGFMTSPLCRRSKT